jgi:hypothetical protein
MSAVSIKNFMTVVPPKEEQTAGAIMPQNL